MECFFIFLKILLLKKMMIHIENGDFELSKSLIELLSSMLIMCQIKIQNLSTSNISVLTEEMKKIWEFKTPNINIEIKIIIAEIQRSLAYLNLVPTTFNIDGIISEYTLNLLKDYLGIKKKKNFIITPKIYKFLLTKAG